MHRVSKAALDGFITALHRRLLLLRAVEGAGLGALAGCAVGGILIALLMWRGVSTLAPTLAALAIGAATGLLWSVARRPTRLQAAVEADRQLALSDLLATALAVAPRSRESDRDAEASPWLQTVLAAADEACRRHAPSRVILHRLGGRAWGGIALAAALVLTLSALTAQEPAARAASSTPGASRTIAGNGTTTNASVGMQRAATAGRGPDRSRSAGLGPESVDGTRTAAPGDAGRQPGVGSSSPGQSTGSPGDAGTGSGAGRARSPAAGESTLAQVPGSASSRVGTGIGAGGTGAPATRPAGGATPSGGTVTPDAARGPRSAPWESSAWPDDARRAHEALEAGQVPDSRRDLVREYFERR